MLISRQVTYFRPCNQVDLDALEWVGPSLDLAMSFQKVAPYYYTGWHEPGTELNFIVSLKAYQELPSHFQKILKTAMRLAAYEMYVQSYHLSSENFSQMQQEFPNVEVRAFPRKVYRELIKVTNKKLDEIAANGDESTKEILDSIRDYQKRLVYGLVFLIKLILIVLFN